MPTEYTNLVTALKALTQGEKPNQVKLPMAEDDWNTRPETVSYGTVALDFEADALRGDNLKVATAYEGSMDLYSYKKSGDGWVPLIEEVLTEHCDSCWRLDYHTHERETGLYRWEWVFQIEG